VLHAPAFPYYQCSSPDGGCGVTSIQADHLDAEVSRQVEIERTSRRTEEIPLGLAKGSTLTAIAAQLGRSTSTISREVGRNNWERLDDSEARDQVAAIYTRL
jgi:Helix-turn-helix domain